MTQLVKPKSIRLDASTNCQLKCPSCPTAQGIIQKNIGGGFLRFQNFKKLIDENPSVLHVELSNWGEIFLNPDLPKIMAYAYEKSVALTASNGTNLNTVKKETLEALVKYKFRHLNCSIDGASQETYSIYRRNGNFTQVIENIKTINHYKAVYNSPFPILSWQYVAFGHNEHEIEKAQKLAKTLNMDLKLKLSWDENFSPLKNQSQVEEKAIDKSQESRKFCSQLWHIPQINWDGRILGCCVNYWEDFGNAFDAELDNSLNNDKITYARQMLLGKTEAKENIPCTSCKYYQQMQKNDDWLTDAEISAVQKHKLAYSLGRLGIWLTNKSRLLSTIYLKLSGLS
ncbi:MAG: radical SAM/SPASM domain-containing protein [Waterburya sp.]